MKAKILLCLMAGLFVVTACKKDDDKDDVNNNPPAGYPTDKLISYWNFDDNLKDQVGTTPDGANHGATFVEGKAGKALNFDGNGQFVQFPRNKFRTGNTVSASCWFKQPITPNTSIYFVICNDFAIFTTDQAGFLIATTENNMAKGPFSFDVWTHLVGTYDGTDIKIYINGQLANTTNHPGTITGATYNLSLGTLDGTDHFWNGNIDDLFIYDKALSQEEVTKLYNYHK